MARELATIVRALRIRAGLSPTQLAKRAGIDTAIVYRTEAGSKIPSFKTLHALTRALGFSLDDLATELGYDRGAPRAAAAKISTAMNAQQLNELKRHLTAAQEALDALQREASAVEGRRPTRKS